MGPTLLRRGTCPPSQPSRRRAHNQLYVIPPSRLSTTTSHLCARGRSWCARCITSHTDAGKTDLKMFAPASDTVLRLPLPRLELTTLARRRLVNLPHDPPLPLHPVDPLPRHLGRSVRLTFVMGASVFNHTLPPPKRLRPSPSASALHAPPPSVPTPLLVPICFDLSLTP